jgi:hypothetical protein
MANKPALHSEACSPSASASTEGDAQAIPANTDMSACHVQGGMQRRIVAVPKKANPRNKSTSPQWERPKWVHGFLWSKNSLCSSPSATSTEFADPFPPVPASVLKDDAAQLTIAMNPALFRIVTPINVSRFKALLVTHPNQLLVASVCRGLREGVWPFALPSEAAPTTFDFSQREVPDAGLDFLREQWDLEITAGHYSPSFGSDLLPGMYSTPVGVAPKPHSEKFRLIDDLSAGPHAPQIMDRQR